MDLFKLDLGQFGAPGFTLQDRLDMTGHRSGLVCPLPVNKTGLLFQCRIHCRHENTKSNQTDTNTT